MHTKHLESFIATAESGSFSTAAEKLFVSRTALIQQINLLEQRVGVTLLHRHSKGVSLTPAGAYFLTEAKKIVRISQRTTQRCRDMQEKDTVRIGALPNFAPFIMTEICRQFSARYPNVNIKFIEYPLEEYFQRFQEDKFDITTDYLAGYIYDHPDYRVLKLMEDKHCCGVPKGHPLADRTVITAKDLVGQSIVMYPRGITKADDRLRDYLLKHIPDVDIIDTVSYDRNLPLKCELSSYILIYYSSYAENFAPLVTIPLGFDIEFPIDLGIGYKADAPLTVQQFIAVARETCQVK